MSNTHTDILLAGAFAAFTVDLLVYPLDTLKTRFQSPDYKRLYTVGVNNAINKRVFFRGLYQGVGSVILATLPSSGAFFTTYEAVKSGLSRHNPNLRNNGTTPLLPQPLIHATASSIGELVSCFILTPAEVLKQNAQMIDRPSHSHSSSSSSSTKNPNSGNATLQALRRFKHPTQLWRGYTALVVRNLPFTAMQFPLFEHLKQTIKERRKAQGKSTGSLLETGTVTAVSAGSAGALSAVLTTPVDVVKTRIMLGAANDGGPSQAPQPQQQKGAPAAASQPVEALKHKVRRSGWAVGKDVLRQEGMRGLWRGGALRGLWTALGSGLYLGVYESGRAHLEARRLNAKPSEGASIV
ncbi:MAG: hypothetical protein M4579_001075 [Chaenotheca gracillima]|nr:MAG: hypothetical protein M4579_001075 [Chaenotheca gracillima]